MSLLTNNSTIYSKCSLTLLLAPTASHTLPGATPPRDVAGIFTTVTIFGSWVTPYPQTSMSPSCGFSQKPILTIPKEQLALPTRHAPCQAQTPTPKSLLMLSCPQSTLFSTPGHYRSRRAIFPTATYFTTFSKLNQRQSSILATPIAEPLFYPSTLSQPFRASVANLFFLHSTPSVSPSTS